MVQELVEGTIEWFNKRIRLHVGGLDINKELIDEKISIANLECLWGQKKSRNGFKVNNCIDPNLVTTIQELWPLVYEKSKVTNGSISISFAKGVLTENNKFKVTWVYYASQAQVMGRRGHKKLTINNVKILKNQSLVAKVMASTNVIAKLPNVVAGSGVFTTPMAFEEIHVKKVLVA